MTGDPSSLLSFDLTSKVIKQGLSPQQALIVCNYKNPNRITPSVLSQKVSEAVSDAEVRAQGDIVSKEANRL